MENKKRLKCVESYEEDLTGNDDYIELWTAGEIYDAIKNEDGSYTVRTIFIFNKIGRAHV